MVATDDDFAIFLADTVTVGDDPYHYHAEFAGGAFYASCGASMPAPSGRAAAIDLWPPRPGQAAKVDGEVLIGDRDQVLVGEHLIDVVWSAFTYGRNGTTYTDRFAVAPDFSAAFAVRFDDGSVGVVREFRPADGIVDNALGSETELLGDCALLLR